MGHSHQETLTFLLRHSLHLRQLRETASFHHTAAAASPHIPAEYQDRAKRMLSLSKMQKPEMLAHRQQTYLGLNILKLRRINTLILSLSESSGWGAAVDFLGRRTDLTQ